MTWEDGAKILLIVNTAGTLGLAVLHLWLRANFVPKPVFEEVMKASANRVDGHADRLNGLDKRLAVIEEELRHLPTADDFAALTSAVGSVQATQAAQGATLTGVAAAMTRVEDYLLRHKP